MGRIGIQAGGHPHIFPNMWITGNQVWLRLPKGPMKTELWAFLMLDKNLPREEKKRLINMAEHGFGPAGLWEQDDGENWDQSTRGMVGVVAKRAPLHYGMNLGRGEIIDEEGGPPYIETHINEHAQLWHYRSWAEWMAAMSWQDLKNNHSQPTGTL
jgi:3-phenylpropionate/trans-cinnamate dioxygenase alpha subunit